MLELGRVDQGPVPSVGSIHFDGSIDLVHEGPTREEAY